MPGTYLLKILEIPLLARFKIRSFVLGTGILLQDKMFALPFSGEKHVKLFRRVLLKVIEGSRLRSHCEYSQYVGVIYCDKCL